ncbi:hypothetical protein SAMN05428944_0322 [Streptomyces sp. 1222.5]|nr:hypothetical protein BX260_7774 [Streptomyces sp. 5112.2]SEB56735.1 hypothetical protein SAMN05428944_0322 [Streptomyces sp. 1222.5]
MACVLTVQIEPYSRMAQNPFPSLQPQQRTPEAEVRRGRAVLVVALQATVRPMVALTLDGLARMQAALPFWSTVQSEFEESFGADKAAQLRATLEDILDTGFRPWAE